MDVRSPEGVVLSWVVPADVECLAWSPHQQDQFVVSVENGYVMYFDARAGSGSSK